MADPDPLLALADVTRRTSLARSTIYAHMRTGAFPAPLKLCGGPVRWRASDIARWTEEQQRATYSKPARRRA